MLPFRHGDWKGVHPMCIICASLLGMEAGKECILCASYIHPICILCASYVHPFRHGGWKGVQAARAKMREWSEDYEKKRDAKKNAVSVCVCMCMCALDSVFGVERKIWGRTALSVEG